MKFPTVEQISTSRDMTTYFMGYNAATALQEGEFFDMKNISTKNYPALSPRNGRKLCKRFTSFQGVLDGTSLIWIDNRSLYIDGVKKTLSQTISTGKKSIYKMAAYVIILPDKIWYNTDSGESGYIDNTRAIGSGTSVSFTLCNINGTAITWHDDAYYQTTDPKNGDYLMTTTDGKSSLRVYSSVTKIWSVVTTTYMKIAASGIGSGFKKEDGVTITVDNTNARWSYAGNIFVNDEGNNKLSLTTTIFDCGANYITIPALLNENKTFTNLPVTVARKMPDVAYMTECQNRMWACSTDGHEIYCCKLGDVTNWNYFTGVSIDSYAATVGSDGKFTGATTYNLHPIFFKENSFIKVTVSGNGAHSYREQPERGMQQGSEKSICLINGVLYYKGVSCIYAFDGSSPSKVSDKLGEHRYFEAVGGTMDGRYYLSMKDSENVRRLFVYDTRSLLWAIEDDKTIDEFCEHKGELYMISGNDLISVSGNSNFGTIETEKQVSWQAESGKIGLDLPDNKYVGRIRIRMSMDVGSHMDFYIEYDSDGIWHHCFNVSGKGTQSFMIPVIPRRCDHFRYKMVGKGNCTVYSITKTIEEGSDG